VPTVGGAGAAVFGRDGEPLSAAGRKFGSTARRMRAAGRRDTVVRMTRRLEALARDPRVQRAIDVALALLLAGASLVELFFVANAESSWGGRGPLQAALALGATLPLAWRRDHPVLVASAINMSTGALVLLAAPHQGAFEPFVAVIVAAYSLGAHTRGRLAVPALLLQFAIGLPWSIAAAAKGEGTGNVLPSIVWIVGAWIIGRIILGRRLRTHELELLTHELEAQRELQANAAVAVERARIARELHDVIAHNVSMMVVQAGAAARVLEGDQPHVRRALEAVEVTGRETVDEMRRLIGVVRSDDGLALAPQPTLSDLERLVAQVREAGLAVDLRIEGSRVALPPGIDLSAYRIVQEALTNALKHAGEASATVVVRYGRESVELEVSDDGDGSGTGGGTGHGLIGMRERVALWGGELEAGRRAGGGFAVRARLPVSA
jgi:signal transduction histidine kinase